jgi:NADH-quinone oxidoreductase subunit N
MAPVFDAETARLLTPLFILTGAGALFFIWGAMAKGVSRLQQALIVLAHIAVFYTLTQLWDRASYSLIGGMLVVDNYTLFFTGVCTLCSLATVLVSPAYMARFGISRSEYYGMLFFSLAGMFVLVSAHNLMSLFLGIELMSMAIYVMVGFRRRDLFSNEAALKYFLLGAFAIAFFLYGMSLVYGLTGTLNYKGIVLSVIENEYVKYPPFQLAVALIIVGLVFKVAAVPFHMWVPDVYQGAPSPVTGFMASAVKAASFAAFLRLFYMSFMASRAHWVEVIIVLAVLTMSVGNIVALVQRNVKRMLAYSSIAHAGYILVGMAAISVDNTRAASSVMFYLLVYAFMTLGAFALMSALEKRGGSRGQELDDMAGLGWRKPFLGVCMTILMFSMAGIPPFSGFFAKYYIFSAAVERGLVTLAVIGVLNSALSLYYYLRVIVYMYMRQPHEEVAVFDDWGMRVVLGLSVLLTIWLGLAPSGTIPGIESVLEWAQSSLTTIASVR